MPAKFPFRFLEPYFCSGLFDDPILLVRISPSKRMLMFDCGQNHHLAKRIFSHLDAVFISHAHMDHWMGIDSVIRHLIVADRTIHIFGPDGLAAKMDAKLKGYDWNLTENYWCNCEVHEITEQTLTSSLFIGAEGFSRQPAQSRQRKDLTIYTDPHCQVKAEICYHDIPSIVYRIEEKPPFIIDQEKLKQSGLKPGPWIAELKKAYFSGSGGPDVGADAAATAPDTIQQRQLLSGLLIEQTPLALGYISDMAFNVHNFDKLQRFLNKVQLLISECTYLTTHHQRARAADHLCTADINQMLKALQPDYFLPMHLSKSYRKDSAALYRELSLPSGTQLITLPDFVTPQPLRTDELIQPQALFTCPQSDWTIR